MVKEHRFNNGNCECPNIHRTNKAKHNKAKQCPITRERKDNVRLAT